MLDVKKKDLETRLRWLVVVSEYGDCSSKCESHSG